MVWTWGLGFKAQGQILSGLSQETDTPKTKSAITTRNTAATIPVEEFKVASAHRMSTFN